MTEVIRSYINDGIGLIQIAAVLIVGFVVLAAWTKTRSITGTVGAMVVGALVLGYIFNAEWFGQKMAEDIVTRENGMPVLAGSVLPSSTASLEGLALLAARTAITVLWVIGATLAVVLVVRALGWRFDVGSPRRAARRGLLRARWRSVARSSGLAVTKDRRAATGLQVGSVVALLTGPMDKLPGGASTAKPQPVERLPRLSHGRASPDRLTIVYKLTPARGQTVEDIADHAQALADGLHVERVVVRRVGTNAGELVAYLGDVFRLPRAWQPTVMPAAIPWGTDEAGATAVFRLGEGHALIAGSTGSGKSGFLNSFVASAAIRPDVALLGVDLKGGVELGPWAARFTDVAVDPGQAARLVAAVAEEVRRRYTVMADVGVRKMTSSDQGVGPWVLFVIDELSELLDTIEKGDLVSIGRLARACGIALVVATQRPTAKTVTADLRDQLDALRWCGRTPPNSTTGDMVLGEDCPLDPSTIGRDRKGVGVLDDVDGARFARPWWLEDRDVAQVAARTAHLRVPVEHVLVGASSTRAAA